MPNDGLNGAIQDSGQVRLEDCGAFVATLTQSITRGVIRVQGRETLSEARDWTLYEAVDWKQQGVDGDFGLNTQRSLRIDSQRLIIGRGRVAFEPYMPPVIPTGDPRINDTYNVPWCRARARSFRATSIDYQVGARGVESGAVGANIVVMRDNYRAWICEGRPVEQRVSNQATVLPQAGVVVAGNWSISNATIPLTCPIPDFATGVRLGAAQGGSPMAVGWLDQFGAAFVPWTSCQNNVSTTQLLAVPQRATRMILTAAGFTGAIPVEWECLA